MDLTSFHFLRPWWLLLIAAAVAISWLWRRRFAADYRRLLAARRRERPEAFDALARAAREGDLWLGCNCPTARNPDVRRCHTFLALAFLSTAYPDLEVAWPA